MDTTAETSFKAPASAGTLGVESSADQTAAAAERAAQTKVATEAAAAERSARRAEGQDILSRVVKGAHEAIDRIAETAAPHVHRLEDTVGSANVSMRSRAGQAREVSDEWADSLRDTVRDNPLAAVAAAVALGVLVARLAR